MRWYRVLSYNPALQTCVLAPASQSQSGILYDVPIALWGGSWADQKRSPLRLTQTVDPGQWGEAAEGPRWGVALPIQQGDMAKVEYPDGNTNTPLITSFAKGIIGSQGPSVVGVEQGEAEGDRLDLLLPSGAWARCLGDGTWIISTPPVGSPGAQLTLSPDGTITLDGAHLVVNTPTVTVNGQTSFTQAGQVINGKAIAVVGAVDSAGHPLVSDNQ